MPVIYCRSQCVRAMQPSCVRRIGSLHRGLHVLKHEPPAQIGPPSGLKLDGIIPLESSRVFLTRTLETFQCLRSATSPHDPFHTMCLAFYKSCKPILLLFFFLPFKGQSNSCHFPFWPALSWHEKGRFMQVHCNVDKPLDWKITNGINLPQSE